MMDQARAVSLALQEMNPGHGRQALEIVHAEAQRTIHQGPWMGEAMLLRIDLRKWEESAVGSEVKMGRCDDIRRNPGAECRT